MEMTYSQAFADGVAEEMLANPDIFMIGTDLKHHGGHWGQARGLAERVGEGRIFDAPISEAAIVATGVGAALAGMRPIVDLNFIDFTLGAMDEIINQAAKIRYMMRHDLALVIRATSGVAMGGPQHNNSLEACFMSIPCLNVVTPATPYDAKGLIKTCLRDTDPVVFLMNKRLTGQRGEVGGQDDLVPIGRASVARPGNDCTVVTFGAGLVKSLQAATELEVAGVSVEVIDVRTLSPLDVACLASSASKTHRVFVVEETPRFAGPGAEIAASIQEAVFADLAGPVVRISAPDLPIPECPPLVDTMLPSIDRISQTIKQVLA